MRHPSKICGGDIQQDVGVEENQSSPRVRAITFAVVTPEATVPRAFSSHVSIDGGVARRMRNSSNQRASWSTSPGRLLLRPPIAQERVEQQPDALVRLTLKKAYAEREASPLGGGESLATEVFELWLDGVKDRRAGARIQARVDRAEDGNFGDCKPVGEGVSEMGTQMGSEVVILLAGGDKSTQASDIRGALRLARRLEV